VGNVEAKQFEVRHPEVEVELSGMDGNIYFIIGAVRRALRRADVSREEIEEFSREMTESGSYDKALQTVMRWVDVS
jgi:hypothetical protein